MTGDRFAATAVLLILTMAASAGRAQMPLEPSGSKGRTMTPVYEGWYRNADGTFSMSFGYFNRNFTEVLEIPVGENNFFAPGPADRGQPTQFQPRRHWGVFAVTVPEDFGYERLVWTVKIRGQTFSVPGALNRDWEIDALVGEAGSGNTPPTLSFHSGGPEGAGPAGVTGEPMSGTVGKPLAVTVFVADDGRPAGAVRDPGETGKPVKLKWFKHQGPGDVSFEQPNHEVDYTGGEATTAVTFSDPGTYILRVRANDASGLAGAGYAQCCWTNGFVTVNVTD